MFRSPHGVLPARLRLIWGWSTSCGVPGSCVLRLRGPLGLNLASTPAVEHRPAVSSLSQQIEFRSFFHQFVAQSRISRLGRDPEGSSSPTPSAFPAPEAVLVL